MKLNIRKLLQVKAEEDRIVFLVLLHSFFIGAPRILTQTASMALFFSEYDAQSLPFVYIGSAVVVSVCGILYSACVTRFHFRRITYGALMFLIASLVILRFALGIPDARWPVFCAAIWYEVVWLLTSLEFWGLAGKLFDVRQAKRLYGLIGSGEILAMTAAGFIVPALLTVLNTEDLLLIASGSLFCGMALLPWLLPARGAATERDATSEPEKKDAGMLKSVLRERYIVLILLLAVFSYASYYIIDNAFFERASAQFPDQEQLAGFLGRFFAVAGFLTLLCRTLLTGFLITQCGLIAGLIALPLALAAGCLLTAASGAFSAAAFWVFGFIAITRMAHAVLGDSIDQSTMQILYRPLSSKQRSKAQAAVEGIVGPIAGGFTGLALVLLNRYAGVGAIHLSSIAFCVLVVWLLVLPSVRKHYINALMNALGKRRIEEVFSVSLYDKTTLSLVIKGLDSPRQGEVLYCLKMLDEIGYSKLDDALLALIHHSSPEVRRAALEKIRGREMAGAKQDVRTLMKQETHPATKAAAIETFCALGGLEALDEASGYLDDHNTDVRLGAIYGLANHCGKPGARLAKTRLEQLEASSDASDREFAARAHGVTGLAGHAASLSVLLSDESRAVRKAALVSAQKSPAVELAPSLIQHLEHPRFRNLAMHALSAIGEEALPALRDAFKMEQNSIDALIWITRSLGRIGGKGVFALLEGQIRCDDEELSLEILNALSRSGYSAPAHLKPTIRDAAADETSRIAWNLEAIRDIGDHNGDAILSRGLRHLIDRCEERIFLLLSFAYNPAQLKDIHANLKSANGEKRANALELLENIIEKEWFGSVIQCLESHSPEHDDQRIGQNAQRSAAARNDRLREIMERDKRHVSSWVKSCALYLIGKHEEHSLLDQAQASFASNDSVMREIAAWAIGELRPNDMRERLLSLTDDADPYVGRIARHVLAMKN